ncbi:cytochrome P450 4V2-like [Macrosteles quadrilineatus]|uniref:cytochrome P450 4V2-like n=1 Tax=Macrosteles quadrilineatus TaxID=74068 RepID=UPI0023E17E43|nr:cytochrome P450 4V2-like [Macrosteles quadrilineatus]XP_054263175.1 cytochrome P450 4V2-like [Macrosteles quadrilineatus]
MWSLVLVCVSLVLLLVLLDALYRRKNHRLQELARKLPTPFPIRPLIGTYYCPSDNSLVYNSETFAKHVIEVTRLAAKHKYSVFCDWIGPKPLIFIQKPADIQIILNSSKGIFKNYSIITFLFGQGLLTASGSRWKATRRLISPLFHPQNLQRLAPLMNKNAEVLVGNLSGLVGKGFTDVFDRALGLSVRSICALVFGTDAVCELNNKTFDLGLECVHRGSDLVQARAFRPWLWLDRVWEFMYNRALREFQHTWEQFVSQPVEIIKRQRLTDHKEDESADSGKFNDVYSPLSVPGLVSEAFSPADVEWEMKTFVGTGTDSIAVSLSSCLLMLGKHQDVQEMLYQDIISVVGTEEKDITVDDLYRLPYLTRVIKETLRVCMVLPVVSRTLPEDIQLGEYKLPKGAMIFLSLVGLHFDPEVYQDPHVFNPDRFTPDLVTERHPYSFLPFSGGPRNCIGKQYAYMLLKIALIHILKTFKVSSDCDLENMRFGFVVTLNNLDGYKVAFERRS